MADTVISNALLIARQKGFLHAADRIRGSAKSCTAASIVFEAVANCVFMNELWLVRVLTHVAQGVTVRSRTNIWAVDSDNPKEFVINC